MSELLKNIIRFILLILLQVFVLNRIMLHGLATPYLYMIFILLLPFNIPRWALMVCGLALGLSLDMFMNTPGMHAAACLVMAYLRPFVINILSPQGGFETARATPSVASMGWSRFMMYALILISIHHFVYFTLEIFDFHDIIFWLLKIILSLIASFILVFLFEMLLAAKTR
ncbi:MAG: rod shape-determining protein MreD [Chitinophagaceae bacterium]|jgi:rod shape-determining protein MreD|nr:MAG: rod shape-determining protein MreD [Chitinophagaceae bacterium]